VKALLFGAPPDKEEVRPTPEDELETMLAATGDGAGRAQVMARLEALVFEAGDDGGEGVADESLDSASDSEMFDLIDKELGGADVGG